MANPNKLSRFWQELKRRNVVRVITIYSGAAFVILELVDIIAEPLKLPSWLLPVVIVLLSIGFIIAVILSWIYDVHPEGGIVKTESVDDVKEVDIPKSSNSWKIASYVSFVVILGLIVLNVIPRTGKKKILDKSIAVLPFTNLSTDEENTYFIDGVMESILDNLCKIADLRVPGRTSMMQYRDNPKPISIVAEEMDVAYVLEGSGQKIEKRLLLTVQLIIGNEDRHIWSKQYDRVIENVEDLIDIQKEIAQLVANEIEAIITPEEKQIIEMIPTTNLMALNLYQQGREEYWNYWFDGDNGSLNRAEDLYFDALTYDSNYAEVYAGLANIYWIKNYYLELMSESFLDSVLVLANKSLHYNNKLSEAYVIRGRYYDEWGQYEQAAKEFEKAIQYNPNDWLAYLFMGRLYNNNDFVKCIDSYHKAAIHNRGPEFPTLLRYLGNILTNSGFLEKGEYYRGEALSLDGDSLANIRSLANIAGVNGDYTESVRLREYILKRDSSDVNNLANLASNYAHLNQFEESKRCYEDWLKKKTELDDQFYRGIHRMAYTYYQIGDKKEAEYYFDKMLELTYTELDLDRKDAREGWANYNLACVYAFRGDTEKAFENLRLFNKRKTMPLWMVTLINNDFLFDSIRDEPEFQQILSDVEAKFQAEHERVRQWLEKNDML